jgi:hypothetical protein
VVAVGKVKVTFEVEISKEVEDNENAIQEAMDQIAEDVVHSLSYHKNFEVSRVDRG